jgi:hypothetical protein
METLTLVQTGKRSTLPLILIDEPGGTYWKRWLSFLKNELLSRGLISQTDFTLFECVESVDQAIVKINHFYCRYHSLRYVGDKLVIRLNTNISLENVKILKNHFSDILTPKGTFILSKALPQESDESEITHLPRLVIDFNREDFGRLRQLIDRINSW